MVDSATFKNARREIMWIVRCMGAVCTSIGLALLVLMTIHYGMDLLPKFEDISTLLGITLVVLGLYLITRRNNGSGLTYHA